MLASTSAMADHHKSGGYDKSKGVDKMFERIDADGDGVITREEFTRHSQERFNKMDINNT
jgi:Ca2+-binding EF-hand superfamily protein